MVEGTLNYLATQWTNGLLFVVGGNKGEIPKTEGNTVAMSV